MNEGVGRRGFVARAAAALAALRVGAIPLAERAAARPPRRIYRIDLDHCDWNPQRILSLKHLAGGPPGAAAAEFERVLEEAIQAGRVTVGRLP
jgi:hypothetical protein